jgi:alpha-tubulin suppressor-like RCC1 family protein
VQSLSQVVTQPTLIDLGIDWKSVKTTQSNGSFSVITVAIKRDGSIWTWGDNSSGALGVGSGSQVVTSPAKVDFGATWETVIADKSSPRFFAINSDSNLWGWGPADGGSYPIEGQDWNFLAAGEGRNFAIRKDGSLWAWGFHESGQLGFSGSGDYSYETNPVRIGAGSDWKFVTTDGGRTFGIKADGSLWAWGLNASGSLGLGSSAEIVTTPTRVGTDTDWNR